MMPDAGQTQKLVSLLMDETWGALPRFPVWDSGLIYPIGAHATWDGEDIQLGDDKIWRYTKSGLIA